MAEESKGKPEVKFYVATRDEVIETTSTKLRKTIEANQPCIVYTEADMLKRILKYSDRTSFEVHYQ